MIRTIDSDGLWWVPELPHEKVAGRLHFSDETGLQLSLFGSLGESGGPGLSNKAIPIVHGWIFQSGGKSVTLKKCLTEVSEIDGSGIPRETFRSERLFLGAHLDGESDFQFSELTLDLSGLSDWASSYSGLSTVPFESPNELSTHFKRPATLEGEIPGGQLILAIEGTAHFDRRESTLGERVVIKISCDQPRSDEALFRKLVRPLENFLTLATDHPNAFVDIAFARRGHHESIGVMGRRLFPLTKTGRDLLPHKMLFCLDDVKGREIELMGRWLEVSERLDGTCNLYFGMLRQVGLFTETQFLLIVNSLFAYQNERGNVSDPVSNSHPLQLIEHNITSLLEEHRETIGPLFRGDKGEASSIIMRYWNYVMFRTSKIYENSDYTKEIYFLRLKLMFLMKACFCRELGFTVMEQRTFFQRNQLYLHLLGLSST